MPTGNNTDRIIKRISADTIPDIEKLYAQVYQKKPPVNYYKNKLATSFAGIEFAGFIAYAKNGTPVASLCIIPCFISQNNLRISAAQLTDGMTDPDYRGSGLFSYLSSAILDLAKQEGIDIVFGFPNQNAYPLLLHNGWNEMERLHRFEIPVKRSVKWLINRVSRPAKVNYEERTGCSNSVLADGFAGIERSKGYLLYKLFAGTGIIKADTAKAWIKADHDLAIGDMIVDENNFEEMIQHIQAVAVKTGAGKIHFQGSPGTSLYKLFSKRYEAIPSFPVVIKKLNPKAETDRIKFTFADIDIF
ncbi:MAG: GNAT family N-acetyltransferase [Chitinophagaceae bacterium]